MSKYRHKKSYRTKKKKHPLRFLKSKIFWIILLFLIIIGGLAYLFIFSDVFEIKNVSISGNEKCPYDEVSEIVSSNIGNIFFSGSKNINSQLEEAYPEIDDVKIKKKLPDSLTVEIIERQPVAIACKPTLRSEIKIFGERSESDCFNIDTKGVVFEEFNGDLDLPVIIFKNTSHSFNLGDNIIKKEYLDEILTINSNFNEIEITESYPISKNRLNVKTEEGWLLYFNPQEDIIWQIEKLKILLKEKLPPEERGNLEYVDLRFEKVYIKRLEDPSEE